ncbi:hypothetical protein MXB_3663 [Myxobolus squamalis]|nr:hypothetical protein MXB_3663 [Myxobolus squamalis]
MEIKLFTNLKKPLQMYMNYEMNYYLKA